MWAPRAPVATPPGLQREAQLRQQFEGNLAVVGNLDVQRPVLEQWGHLEIEKHLRTLLIDNLVGGLGTRRHRQPQLYPVGVDRIGRNAKTGPRMIGNQVLNYMSCIGGESQHCCHLPVAGTRLCPTRSGELETSPCASAQVPKEDWETLDAGWSREDIPRYFVLS